MGGCCSAPSSAPPAVSCLPSSSSAAADDNAADTPTPKFPSILSVLLPPASSSSSSAGPHLLQRYRLGEELGRGEFGLTRRCIDTTTGEHLACKTISKRRLRTKVDVADVQREVEIMRTLPDHPNVVKLREAFEDKEAVHLIMEVCEGGELFDRIIARGHYTERAAATIMRTIVEVVQHCHEHGVMHRDLKPENFLFANKSEASPLKAIDFGLSVFFKPGQRFNEIVGSPYYMAPEVLKRNYGPEVDIWSAGVILYILLCGVPPFWAETDEGIVQEILQSDFDMQREPWPKVSESAKDLVRCMLDRNPNTRLTAKQVLEHPWLLNANAAPNVPLGEAVEARLKQFSAMNKFKKKALRMVAEHLPLEEVAGIKQLFQMLDTDKNGTLSLEELKRGLHIFGHYAPGIDIHMLMEAADVDGNGTLDCGEFVTVTVHLKKMHSDEEHLPKVFSYFDKDGNGYIEVDELAEALKEDYRGLSEQAILEIIRDVDMDKDGRISYEEFVTMMRGGTDWKMASRQCSHAMFNALSIRLLKDGSMRTKLVIPYSSDH